MKGLFIPEITAEMFRNGCLESIEALMAEGKIYDIDYEPEPCEDTISRQAVIDAIENINPSVAWLDYAADVIKALPSAQPDVPDTNVGDTISRQGAIDAMMALQAEDDEAYGCRIPEGFDGERAKEVLEQLPSAQPETDEWCTDCKEYDSEKHCCPRFNRVIRNALKDAQPEQKKGKWLRYGEDGYPNSVDTVHWQCDQCLESYFGRTKRIPNYCPNCGAKMEK